MCARLPQVRDARIYGLCAAPYHHELAKRFRSPHKCSRTDYVPESIWALRTSPARQRRTLPLTCRRCASESA